MKIQHRCSQHWRCQRQCHHEARTWVECGSSARNKWRFSNTVLLIFIVCHMSMFFDWWPSLTKCFSLSLVTASTDFKRLVAAPASVRPTWYAAANVAALSIAWQMVINHQHDQIKLNQIQFETAHSNVSVVNWEPQGCWLLTHRCSHYASWSPFDAAGWSNLDVSSKKRPAWLLQVMGRKKFEIWWVKQCRSSRILEPLNVKCVPVYCLCLNPKGEQCHLDEWRSHQSAQHFVLCNKLHAGTSWYGNCKKHSATKGW